MSESPLLVILSPRIGIREDIERIDQDLEFGGFVQVSSEEIRMALLCLSVVRRLDFSKRPPLPLPDVV